jgi:hypothetical protein
LVAAAHETGLLPLLEGAVSSCTQEANSRLAHLSSTSRQMLVLTLLFLGAVGLRRTWDLRGYTGDALGLLSGRKRAYGYFHTERMLSQLAQANGDEVLTDAFAGWTAQLWHPPAQQRLDQAAAFYIDGHRKPVYSDMLIPRGLVGRLSTVLGCRALVLLHDEHGHPLLATTHRGDHHLIIGLPSIVRRYEQAAEALKVKRVIVDREGMAAEFLARLNASGRTVVSVLRTDQYGGLESFTDVGTFVPLRVSKLGQVMQEVAPASIALPLPDHPGESLPLRVALIRDLCRRVPVLPSKEDLQDPDRWDADLDRRDRTWWEEGWRASPAPAAPTTPKLIPIVTTASTIDAVELAQIYTQRWSAQENIIRDFLLPLGLDTNHGYSKTTVENSEVAKRRTALEKRLANVQRWADAARKRSHNASKLYLKRCKLTKERATALYRDLNAHQMELQRQDTESWLLRKTIKEEKAMADAEIEEYQARQWRAYETSNREHEKCERYCREQRELLRALEDLVVNERVMYELDNRKDQVMTVFKVALANLVMWTRDHYFPESFAHATWQRLALFFHLPGLVVQGQNTVCVELRPFNDRQYNRDLSLLCERVNTAVPHLPDGRRLLFVVDDLSHPVLDVQKRRVA